MDEEVLPSVEFNEVTRTANELDAALRTLTFVANDDENRPSSCLITSIDSVGSGIIGPEPT